MPHASSLLELGCGTGTNLAGLPELASLTGLDASPEMLAVARLKVPAATFLEGDMAAFDLGRQFDVVICVFDTLNHLASFDRWTSLFDCASAHLVNGGIFIFDVVTVGGLRRLFERPTYVHDFDGNTMIVNVQPAGDNVWVTDIRIFEQSEKGQFILHRTRIRELGVQLDRIVDAVSARFELVEMTDQSGESPHDDSNRVHFVAIAR